MPEHATDKTRKIKEGLMEQLSRGSIRLPDAHAAMDREAYDA